MGLMYMALMQAKLTLAGYLNGRMNFQVLSFTFLLLVSILSKASFIFYLRDKGY